MYETDGDDPYAPHEDDPYAVGEAVEGTGYRALPPGVAPPVLLWFRLYAGALAALYALCLLMGLVFLYFGFNGGFGDTPAGESLTAGIFYGVLGAALTPLYLVGVWLPRKRWVWVYAIVLLALSMTSCCCLPLAVPLLIYWLRPECKDWFLPE
ncbi:MAG: hypothetical protein KDD82_04790 [Planctomycetes bacterium]|nr:hypothetical protein [Planctomycetota bacterium]